MLLRQMGFSLLVLLVVFGIQTYVSVFVLHPKIWSMVWFVLILDFGMSGVAFFMLAKKPLWGVQTLLSLVVFHFLATLVYLFVMIFCVVKYDPYFVASFFIVFIFSTVFEIWQIVRILHPNLKD